MSHTWPMVSLKYRPLFINSYLIILKCKSNNKSKNAFRSPKICFKNWKIYPIFLWSNNKNSINVQIRTREHDVPYKETLEFLNNLDPFDLMIAFKDLCEIAQEIFEKIVDSKIREIEESETEIIIDKHGSFFRIIHS